MKCHFVYAVPSGNSLWEKSLYKLRSVMNHQGIPIGMLSNRRPTEKEFELWPVKSPYENTKNIYNALSRKIPTNLYHLQEKKHIHFDTKDIFLGHPYFPHRKGCYGVTEMAIRSKNRPRMLALISPLHCDISIKTDHINQDFLNDVDRLMSSADILFAIMGEYWWDQWDISPYAHWKTKMVRLDMAVDSNLYPQVKRNFNAPGKRGFLYIGNSEDPRKGVSFFSQMMSQRGEYPRGWIGSGPDIPNVPRVCEWRHLTPEFMTEISRDFDFFISPAIADPNPTTILESMAWGFPVVCTPQSGYYETSFRRNIYLDDIDKSVSVLDELQYADGSDLLRMADEARLAVETHYTWERFTSTLLKHIGL